MSNIYHVYGLGQLPIEEWQVSIDGALETTTPTQSEAKAFGDANFGVGNKTLLIDAITTPPIAATPIMPDALGDCALTNDFTSIDNNGAANCWGWCMVTSDAVHGYRLSRMFKQETDGNHRMTFRLRQNGQGVNGFPDIDQLITENTGTGEPAPVRILGKGDTVNAFVSRDHVSQILWYVPPDGRIAAQLNAGVPSDFQVTDVLITFMPMDGASVVNFSNLSANCQLGQIFQTAGHIQTTWSDSTYPFAVNPPNAEASNIQQIFQSAPHPGIEGIDFLMRSP